MELSGDQGVYYEDPTKVLEKHMDFSPLPCSFLIKKKIGTRFDFSFKIPTI